jgi:hypothetical protein
MISTNREVLMGGYGSTRWKMHQRKTTVEHTMRLTIRSFREAIEVLGKSEKCTSGSCIPIWTRDGEEVGRVWVRFEGNFSGISAWIQYQALVTRTGEKSDHHYAIGLASTKISWGGFHWWWICPKCGRRVGVLYNPNTSQLFLCRSCHKLAYQSQRETYNDPLIDMIAANIRLQRYPFLTLQEVRKLIWSDLNHKEISKHLKEKLHNAVERMVNDEINRLNAKIYSTYLTADELCEQSGLSSRNFISLQEAHLLLPDEPGGRYRPKLLSWAKKLSWLLTAGWNLKEIKSWSKGRWSMPNPRSWPPNRKEWQA